MRSGHLRGLGRGHSTGHRGGSFTGAPAAPTDLPGLLHQIGLFISYDNATKQLDTVYDITPELAQAFLERISSSNFDMRNASTIHRQGVWALGPQSCFLPKHQLSLPGSKRAGEGREVAQSICLDCPASLCM